MDTTTIIAFACILAIVGIALVAIGIVRTCQRSEFDTSSYGLIETGVIFLVFAIAITVGYLLPIPERKADETYVIEKVVESAQNKDMDIYIDGKPVSEDSCGLVYRRDEIDNFFQIYRSKLSDGSVITSSEKIETSDTGEIIMSYLFVNSKGKEKNTLCVLFY